ncbi:hypothetical protein [uncultured Levyella sp.]|uniref:hypothetical protein n=1 Tax=uncultured Levyella sp. TaxID=1715800 RepID=UPI00258571C8|nr:hypothetical protein [uncultured Levyella sp.]
MSEVNYETAWRFLKSLIEQLRESQTFVAQNAPNASEFDQAKGKTFMAEMILEEMECMEEGIADAMRGDEGNE